MLSRNWNPRRIVETLRDRATAMSKGDIAAAVAPFLVGWAAKESYKAWLSSEVVRLSLSSHTFIITATGLFAAAVTVLVASACRPIVECVRSRKGRGPALRALPDRVMHSVSRDIERATGRIFVGLGVLVGGILGPLVSDYGLRLMTTPTTAAITLALSATALALGGWGARELAIGYLGFVPGRYGTLFKSQSR